MIQPLSSTTKSTAVTVNSNSNQHFASVLASASTLPREQLIQKILVLRNIIAKQAKVANSAKNSEIVATGTGLWEMTWGAFESLAEGIFVSNGITRMGLLISKLAYTLTSGEEFASSAYLVGSYKQYQRYLLTQLKNIDSLISKIKDTKTHNHLTNEEISLLVASLTGDYKAVLSTKKNHDANKVIAGMQVFNFAALGALSLATLFKKEDSRLFNLPKSWVKPVEKIDALKTNLFEGIAGSLKIDKAINKISPVLKIKKKASRADAGKFIEAASVSVPMAVLALYKFYLATQSQDKTFSNTLNAQAMSHVACFVGGASNAYHALWMKEGNAAWKSWENFLTWYEAGTYFVSSGKLLHYLGHNKFTDKLGLTSNS